MAARSKMPTYLAVGAAGVAGYYLYSAGGSPKEAVRKAEVDAHIKTDKPTYARDTGAKIDEAAHNAEKNMEQARDATGSYAKERKDELLRGIDKADQKIEEKAKGWFGGGK
jgi:hypothetical protein